MVAEPLPSWQVAAATLSVSSILLYGIGRLVRARILVPKYTILHDIHVAGKPRNDGLIPGRAIVCGGSVSGLLAAAVCGDHFESVVVIEPEQWANEHGTDLPHQQEYRTLPDGHREPIVARTRIMQYNALHFFLTPVLMGLEALFPELDDELDKFGYTRRQVIIRSRMRGIPIPDPFDEGDPNAPKSLTITREHYETLVRRLLVRSRKNITFVTGTVTGFIREAGAPALTGVTISTREPELRKQNLDGRFIVDATGRQQISYDKCLRQANFDFPPSIRIEYDPHVVYSQSVRTIPAQYHATLNAIIPHGFVPGVRYSHTPDWKTPEQRAIWVVLYQGSQLIICMGAWGVDLPLHTITEVRPYVTSLYGAEHIPTWFLELLDWLEAHDDEFSPWSKVIKPGPLNWIQYQNVDDTNGTLPNNWVAVGDAVMRLNPVYGQGCSKANVDAITLDAVLRAIPSNSFEAANVSRSFFEAEGPRVAGAWDGTKSSDYGFKSTNAADGETLDKDKFGREFGHAIQKAGMKHRDVQLAFLHVVMFLAPATDFFSPWVLGKVLFDQLLG
ncbi:hypothetical protein FRB96_006761 [Tulasnella sp. 330]|nr:hypothetical protein FRB96_006761 [Tulasnella sp. 330]